MLLDDKERKERSLSLIYFKRRRENITFVRKVREEKNVNNILLFFYINSNKEGST